MLTVVPVGLRREPSGAPEEIPGHLSIASTDPTVTSTADGICRLGFSRIFLTDFSERATDVAEDERHVVPWLG